jgi:uncharacterized membrane protein YfcA
MKTPQEIHDSIAAVGASTSMVTAIASRATEFQPIISATSGMIAIITGLFAIIYYMKKINTTDGQDSEQSN